MKNKLILPFVLVLLFAGSEKGNGQWRQSRYVIGTFYDPQIKNCEVKDTAAYKALLKDVKNCNFNLLSGLDGCYDFRHVAFKLNLLAELGLQTLQMNLISSTKKDMRFTSKGASDWLGFAERLTDRQKQALYGYLIFDEPTPKDEPHVKEWIKYFKKNDPGRLSYINLPPANVYKIRNEYASYARRFMESDNALEQPDVVSYDFYPWEKAGLHKDYYYNLNLLRKMAGDRPLWYYVLTTQFGKYRPIGAYELNFCVFAPAVYGAKGTWYFTYQTIVGSTQPYGEALIYNNKPTSKYYRVKKINAFLANVWGPIVMSSKYLGTYHASQYPENQTFDEDQLVGPATPILFKTQHAALAFGLFRSPSGDETYLLVQNKSNRNLQQVPVLLKGNLLSKSAVSVNYNTYTTKAKSFTAAKGTFMAASGHTSLLMDLPAGDVRIIRIIGKI